MWFEGGVGDTEHLLSPPHGLQLAGVSVKLAELRVQGL
jgi:hypothetical protein